MQTLYIQKLTIIIILSFLFTSINAQQVDHPKFDTVKIDEWKNDSWQIFSLSYVSFNANCQGESETQQFYDTVSHSWINGLRFTYKY